MTSDQGAVPIPDEPATRFAAHEVCFTGTCSVLYAGRDEASGREVAVKVLRDTAFPSPADRARALRELQKLATVKHPAIARIVAVGEGDGRVWAARELIEGESLAERLARNGPMGTAETARIASQIAAALGELHRHGVLHGDVRPGHVLIEPSGAVRVIDAALGRVYRTPDNRATTGTPGYVSPESIAGKLVSFRSDLYSLGATVYEMLTGAPPFGLDTPRVLTAQLESDAPALRLAVPPALSKLVSSLLSREPRERPFSAQQVERQLEPMAFAPEADEDPSSTTVVGSTEDLEPEPAAGLGSGLDDDEEFEEPTQLSAASSLVAEARRLSSASAQTEAPPPSSARTPSGTVNAPPAGSPAEGTGSTRLPGTVARTGKPGFGGGDPLHKPTLLGISPVIPPAAKPQAPYGAARAAAQAASTPAPVARAAEGSGRVARTPPRDTSDEFDEAIDTVVQEDSRIFGVPEFGQSNPHGTAVPPLPETLAAQVLTGATRVRRASEAPPASTSGFTQVPTQPDAQPLPGRNIMPGGAMQPAMTSAPNVAPQAPYMPPGAMGMGGYPNGPSGPHPAQGFPGSGGYAAYPHPGAAASGGYPPSMPMGGYPPPGARPTGTYRPAASPDLRALLPWIFAGIGIAGLAGAGGYYVATRNRNHAAPAEPAPHVVPIVVPPAPPPAPVMPPMVLPVAPPPTGHPPVVAPPTGHPPVVVPPAPVVVAPHPPVVPPSRPVTPPPIATVAPRRPVPVHHETPLEHARAQIAHHDLAGARQTLTAASREQPSNAEIHAALGDVAVRLRELPSAIGEFRNASRLAPRNTEYLHRLANAQVAWNDRAGAATTLRMLLQIAPRDAAAQNQLDQLLHGGANGTGANRPASSGASSARPGTTTVPVFGPPPRTGTQPAPGPAAPPPTSTSIFHR